MVTDIPAFRAPDAGGYKGLGKPVKTLRISNEQARIQQICAPAVMNDP
jgi:hypothetical protein